MRRSRGLGDVYKRQIKYSAIYRSDRDSGIVPEIADIAVKTCHFDKFLIGQLS